MNNRQLYQWVRQVSKDWSGVTRHFRESVVVFSRGVARAQSSQVRKIAGCAGGKADSQRRRLQRFLAPFFKHWTASVVRVLKLKAVVLIVDETKLKDQLGVMVVGLVYDKRCIPLAWRVYRANDAGADPAEGQARLISRLLKQVQAGLPTDLPVRVLTDRGIGTRPLLMRGLIAMGWSFLFRVTKQSKIVLPDGQAVTFYDQVALPGQSYQATGLVFKKRGRIPAHVRVVWGQAAAAPWSLVTNDPSLFGWEYAQRMWIEAAFRDLKSYGWQLEQASLADPQRMARLWVFLVVAYSWMLCWGMALARAGCLASPKRRPDGSQVPAWSLFREGRQAFLTAGLPAAFS